MCVCVCVIGLYNDDTLTLIRPQQSTLQQNMAHQTIRTNINQLRISQMTATAMLPCKQKKKKDITIIIQSTLCYLSVDLVKSLLAILITWIHN